MKKILSIVLVLAMILALAACGKSGDDEQTTTSATTTVTTQAPETTTQAPETTTQAPETTTEPPATTTEAPTTTEPPVVEPVFDPVVDSAEDFANMKPDGEYVLGADITIDATWNGGVALTKDYKTNIAFVGTLDGKGFTITTSVALFANLQGTVKDLKIAGKIVEQKDGDTVLHNGAVAMWTAGKVVIENVHNQADILGGNTTGGMLGYAATGSDITITNCINDGDITCNAQVGGMIGYVQDKTMTVTGCTNNGNLKSGSYGAGIVGRFGRDAATVQAGSMGIIKDCVNNGDVWATRDQVGGILGYLIGGAEIDNCVNYGTIENIKGCAAGIFGKVNGEAGTSSVIITNSINYGKVISTTNVGGIAGHVGKANQNAKGYRIENCINYGEITVNTAALSGGIQAGGIVGYCWGGGEIDGVVNGILNCVNVGDIIIENTDKSVQMGGILGYANSAVFQLENCINAGNLVYTSTTDKAVAALSLIGYNKNDAPTKFLNNYSIAIGDLPLAVNTATPAAFAAAGTVVTAEQMKSGMVAYELNQILGKEVFFQETGVDLAPVLTKTDKNVVRKTAEGFYTNLSDKAVAIKTAEEFAAMKADGEYYLANDITLTATWNGGVALSSDQKANTPFTGSFDGMGFKVTTNVAMFGLVTGTVKNFTIEGEISELILKNDKGEDAKMNNAAVCIYTNGAPTFANIYNKANITGKDTGAILGNAGAGSDIKIYNCINDGAIESPSGGRVGGIAGCIDGAKVLILNCVNNGNVHTTNYGAGILGRFGNSTPKIENGEYAIIQNCVNYGAITADKSQVGSMLGYLQGGAKILDCTNYGTVTNLKGQAGGIFGGFEATANFCGINIDGCINYGEVYGTTYVGGISAETGAAAQNTEMNYIISNCINFGKIVVTEASGTAYAAGIAGYAWGGGEGNAIINCINAGEIVLNNTDKTACLGSMVGYVNSTVYEITGCINIGNLTYTTSKDKAALTIALIGYNKSAGNPPTKFNNNASIAIGDLPIAIQGETPAAYADAGVIYTADQIKDGTVVKALNDLANANLFYLEGEVIMHK